MVGSALAQPVGPRPPAHRGPRAAHRPAAARALGTTPGCTTMLGGNWMPTWLKGVAASGFR